VTNVGSYDQLLDINFFVYNSLV